MLAGSKHHIDMCFHAIDFGLYEVFFSFFLFVEQLISRRETVPALSNRSVTFVTVTTTKLVYLSSPLTKLDGIPYYFNGQHSKPVNSGARAHRLRQTPQHLIFTALHGMQTRSCDEISVHPSVRLSNACIVTKRKKSQSRFLYHAIDNLV